MKKWILHILLFASLFSMLTTSCSQDEEIADIPSAGTPSEKVTIRFTLDLGEQGGMRSRSSWEWYDEDDTNDSNQAELGIGDENYIDTNSLQVFMFKTDGTYIGGLKDMEAKRQGDSNIYNIKGEVAVDKTAIVNEILECKIMVVANADAATENNGQVTGYDNDATFDHDVTYIPMWGIGTYSINLIQQLQVDLAEPIYMLRSMAKIEVTLLDDVYNNGYRITGATLNNYNAQGYVVPAFMIPETDESTTATTQQVNLSGFVATTDLLTDGVYRQVSEKMVNNDKPLSNIDNKKTYVIYVPEMEKGTDNAPNKVSLQLGRVTDTDPSGNEKITNITESVMSGNPHIVLKDYAQGGSHFDIIRNWYYQYTINQINDGFDLTVTTKPWTLQEINMSFTDIVTYNVTGWTEGTYNQIDESSHYVYMTRESETPKDAEFVFDIVTPENPEYQIGLTNNVDFELATETLINGQIKITVKAKDTTPERPKTALYVFVKDKYGRNVELDLTGQGALSTENQESVNRYTIIQNW